MTTRPTPTCGAIRPFTFMVLATTSLLFAGCPAHDDAKVGEAETNVGVDTATSGTDTGVVFDTDTPTDTGTQSESTTSDPDSSTTPDADAGDTGNDADTSVCNGFGCPCQSNADCLDELCVEGPDGQVCSALCSTECEDDGYRCLPITIGGS
ncbi:MAG: hypothetical protein ACI9MR_002596, partial [Myxococcota bacterium]